MPESKRKYDTNPLPLFKKEKEANFNEKEEKIITQLYDEVHANYTYPQF